MRLDRLAILPIVQFEGEDQAFWPTESSSWPRVTPSPAIPHVYSWPDLGLSCETRIVDHVAGKTTIGVGAVLVALIIAYDFYRIKDTDLGHVFGFVDDGFGA
jgi:hypothetical protein